MANYYLENIKNPKIVLPKVLNEVGHVWYLFVIRTSKRMELQNYLAKNGIQTLIHYPIPPHKQEAYKNYNSLSFPISEQIHEELLSLPLSSVMGIEEMGIIVDELNKFND